jgi:purine-cytosine permease-like protein
MTFSEISIEVIGWFGSVLIVGSYALNMRGKMAANSKAYIWANIIGAVCFAINSYTHGAMPSVAVNIVWIGFALETLYKIWKSKKETQNL